MVQNSCFIGIYFMFCTGLCGLILISDFETLLKGLFTLAIFLWRYHLRQRHAAVTTDLPWPPWAVRQRCDHLYLCCAAQGGQGKFVVTVDVTGINT